MVDNKNNIEANCVNAGCVEGPATTGEGEERRVTVPDYIKSVS
jgi:hypothetical protein